MLDDRFALDQRPGPSANVVLVTGPSGSVLVDCGAGTPASDARLDGFLAAHGGAPALLVCTHWHADHVGGAARLARAGVSIAAGAAEAELIAAGDPRAWDAAWLDWRVAAYAVDRPLRDGDIVADAGVELTVVATPGQTPGHLALWDPRSRTVVTGDLLQRDDVGWMPVGGAWAAGAADALIASVERLAALDARVAIPGHGAPVHDVPAAVERSLARYRRWREDPEPAGWHAARRALVSLAMLEALAPAALTERLERAGWVTDLAALAACSPGAVVERLLTDLTGSGALALRAGLLEPTMPFEPRE